MADNIGTSRTSARDRFGKAAMPSRICSQGVKTLLNLDSDIALTGARAEYGDCHRGLIATAELARQGINVLEILDWKILKQDTALEGLQLCIRFCYRRLGDEKHRLFPARLISYVRNRETLQSAVLNARVFEYKLRGE